MFKGQIYDHLREIRLPYALFYAEPCRILSSARRSHSALELHFRDADVVSLPAKSFFRFDLANGEATVSGRPDVARYVIFVFTNLPAGKLGWKAFQWEDERKLGTIHALVLPLTTKVTLWITTFIQGGTKKRCWSVLRGIFLSCY